MRLPSILQQFFLDCFNTTHLRQFLRSVSDGEKILQYLPGHGEPLIMQVEAAIEELTRRHLVQDVLIQLLTEFPNRASEIQKILEFIKASPTPIQQDAKDTYEAKSIINLNKGFQDIELLGQGGMGIVFAANDTRHRREVAIKLIRKTDIDSIPNNRASLYHEAKALAKVTHHNVVRIFEIHENGDTIFIIMERIHGLTMAKWLEMEIRPLKEIVTHFIDAAHGLAAIHKAGIAHGDFKLSNILLDENGCIKIVDLGLSRHIAIDASQDQSSTSASFSSQTRTTLRGTLAYLAPEQFMGARCSARTDQYSFCVALYQAAYGEHPVTAATSFEMRRPDTPPRWLRCILERGLHRRAELRYPSMTDLVKALDQALHRSQTKTRAKTACLIGVFLAAITLDDQALRDTGSNVSPSSESEALKYLRFAQSLLEEPNLYIYEAFLIHSLGILQTSESSEIALASRLISGQIQSKIRRQPRQAEILFHEALDHAVTIGDRESIRHIWLELAWIYSREYNDAVTARHYHDLAAKIPLSGLSTSASTEDRKLIAVEIQIDRANNDISRAVDLQRQAADADRILFPESARSFRSQDEYAQILARSGDNEGALLLYDNLLRQSIVKFGPNHPISAHAEIGLGFRLLDSNNYTAARRHLAYAHSVLDRILDQRHLTLAEIHLALARIDALTGFEERAIEHATSALISFETHLPPDHASRITALEILSQLLIATDQPKQALDSCQKIISATDSRLGGASHIVPYNVLITTGQALCTLKRCGEAFDFYVRLSAPHNFSKGDSQTAVQQALKALAAGLIYKSERNTSQAKRMFERTLSLLVPLPLKEWRVLDIVETASLELADILRERRKSVEFEASLRRRASLIRMMRIQFGDAAESHWSALGPAGLTP